MIDQSPTPMSSLTVTINQLVYNWLMKILYKINSMLYITLCQSNSYVYAQSD